MNEIEPRKLGRPRGSKDSKFRQVPTLLWKRAIEKVIRRNIGTTSLEKVILKAIENATSDYKDAPDRARWASFLLELAKSIGLNIQDQTTTNNNSINSVNILVMSPQELAVKKELARKHLLIKESNPLRLDNDVLTENTVVVDNDVTNDIDQP